MSTTLKFKRGNTSEAASFLGAEGELYVNKDTDQIHVHDGATTGGAAIMAKTHSPTFTGNAVFSGNLVTGAVKANGSLGTAGQVLSSNGSSTYWATSGNSVPTIGEIKVSMDPPTNGTWLETGKYYSKASYPTLATEIGTIADIGSPTPVPKVRIMPRFDTASVSVSPYNIATDGTTTVIVGGSGHIRYTTGSGNTTWTSVMNPSLGLALYEVRYLNNKFITVGAGGIILTSPDGITWARSHNPLTVALASVAYGGGVFVAVPATASQGLVYSTDGGATWMASATILSVSFNRVIYANGVFVAVGAGGAIYTSLDGNTWTSRTSNTAQALYDIVYANNTYVAVGVSGTIVTAASTDVATWTVRTTPNTSNLLQIIYANSKFVAVGQYGAIFTATDATSTWTAAYTLDTKFTSFTSVVWTGTVYVAVQGNGGRYATSSNGTTWTHYVDPGMGYFYSVGLVGSSGTDVVMLTSSYGPSVHISDFNNTKTRTEIGQGTGNFGGWGFRHQATLTGMDCVAYDGSSTYIAVGQDGQILKSTDGGVSWQGRACPMIIQALYKPVYINSRWFICGNGVLLMSTDGGDTWTRPSLNQSTIESYISYDIAWNGTAYSLVTSGGIYRSTDATTWTSVWTTAAVYGVIWDSTNSIFTYASNTYLLYSSDGASFTTSNIAGVTFYSIHRSNGRTCALGSGGNIYHSTNPAGAGWSSATLAGGSIFYDVDYNSTSGTWAFCGSGGTVWSTTDFSNWTSRNVNAVMTFYRIFWTGTYWVAFANATAPGAYSTDLVTWYLLSPPVAGTFLAGTYINNRAFAIAAGAISVLYSTDGINYRQPTNWNPGVGPLGYARKLNGVYYMAPSNNQTGSVFTSNDGISWAPMRDLGPTGTHVFAYNGSQWGVLSYYTSNAMPMTLRTSNNGIDFNISSYVGGHYAGNVATVLATGTLNDFTAASNTWIVKIGSYTFQQGIQQPLYTSNDSVTWVPRQLPSGNAAITTSTQLASNGSVAIISIGSTTDGYGQTLKTTDGGVTWTAVPVGCGAPTYDANSGIWMTGVGSISTDLVNFKRTVSLTYTYGYAISNGYIITLDANLVMGGRTITSIKGGGSYSSYPTAGYTAPNIGILGNINQPWHINSANAVLIFPNTYLPSYSPHGVLECNLYSYDTNTTFFVPPVFSNAPTYVYAGN